nr:MAG TPA: hypothetical protein [Caudoviricetes sp.]
MDKDTLLKRILGLPSPRWVVPLFMKYSYVYKNIYSKRLYINLFYF